MINKKYFLIFLLLTLFILPNVHSIDISTATYNTNFSLSGQSIGEPYDLYVSNDGLKLYVLQNSNKTIYQYSLTTANDLSTISYASKSYNLNPPCDSPLSINLSNNLDKMYCISNAYIYQYTLSSAGDISTSSYASKSYNTSYTNATSLFFKEDGSKLYLNVKSVIYQYSLSTAWDITTMSYDSKSADISAKTTESWGISFTNDGTSMIVNSYNGYIYQYNLSTAWDVSTASYFSTLDLTSKDTELLGSFLSYNSSTLLVMGRVTDTIYSYDIDISSVIPSVFGGTYYQDFNVTLTTDQPNSTGIFYTTDGTDPDNTDTEYTGAITINSTTNLKAVSYDGSDYTPIMSQTYTILEPYLSIQFYDENSGLKMDDNLYLTISGTDYYADETGLWNYNFSDIGITSSQIINATVNSTGYTERDFSYYFFYPYGYDYNFLMLPSSLGLSIDFRARDLSDNLWTNKFVSFEALSFDASGTTIENSLLGSYKTNNSGEFIAFIDSDADYNAVLYNATGVEETTYQKTNVIVSKPKNEITGSDISPYDLSVGNLLSYTVTNSTNATESIMIFGGTISQYLFRVVDYNSIPADRVYIPRTYSVNNPFGSEYSTTYNLQPYLLSEDDGIIPTLYVVDNLNRPIANVLIKIYKTFNNDTILTESLSTDGSGRIVFSAYPLDTYIFEAYYKDELVNTLSFVPRTSNDIFFMKIDLTNITNYTNYNVITVDLSNLNSSYTTTDNPIDFNISLYANDPTKLTSYTANLIQGTTVLDTTTSSVTQTAYTQGYEINFDSTGIEEGSAKVQVIVSYTEDDVTYTKTFYKTIFITSDTVTPETALKNLKTNEGNLLTIFLSLLITVAIVGLISMSGLYVNTNALVLLGVLILGFFVAIGWLSTGTTILGTDPLIFLFSIIVIFTLYKLFSSNQEN